jgi:hypothetical protein
MTQLALAGCMDVVLAPGDEPDRDTWCTPKWLADAVGEVDLDPCTNSRSHIQAKWTRMLEHGQDGLLHVNTDCPATKALKTPFDSVRTWINPPYSAGQVIRWIRAYRHTRFTFLVRLDPSTAWFDELFNASELVLVPRGKRIDFEPPPGVKASSNPFPHALFYASAADATPEIRRLCYRWKVIA